MANSTLDQVAGLTREDALALDKKDPLARLRQEFIIPSKADLISKIMKKPSQRQETQDDPCIYLCGNSLGLQPRRLAKRIEEHLSVWSTKGVHGHFFEYAGEAPPSFLHADEAASQKMAPIVGASQKEVAVMETLTANLHFMMASFYNPTKEKYKIILEGKAFPSDHYAVRSQIIHHGLDPEEAMVLIDPIAPLATMSTEQILATIDEHASSTTLVLLPGIQYYSGQYLDIKTITEHAHKRGLFIGWDLAHAAGNVPLHLHDWNVDFAAWCTYKYMNSGPGAIAALFVHEKHGRVVKDSNSKDGLSYRPRLSGWWGGEKNLRFDMAPRFVPIAGAAGYQVGNVNALAVTAVLASLEIFEQTSMEEIRTKAISITGFLEKLLLQPTKDGSKKPYWIITPSKPEERGSQLSVQLEPGLLDAVMEGLEDGGVVLDERKPDVIRIAPAPLYNTYTEVWDFMQILDRVCDKAASGRK